MIHRIKGKKRRKKKKKKKKIKKKTSIIQMPLVGTGAKLTFWTNAKQSSLVFSTTWHALRWDHDGVYKKALWDLFVFSHSSGAVWESRWPSGLSVLTRLMVSVDVKQYWTMLYTHWSQLVPKYVYRHPRTLSNTWRKEGFCTMCWKVLVNPYPPEFTCWKSVLLFP